jgi:CBS domain-containing protein
MGSAETQDGRPHTVHDVMRSAVTTVERHSHLAAAAYLMHRANASAVVVTSDDEAHAPIAVITEADIIRVVADGRDANSVRIEEMIGPEPVTVPQDTPVTAAAQLMMSHRIRDLPVTDKGRLIGMVDITDACRALLEMAEA